jgi:ABC-type sugar transport system ATPase subunit
MPAIAMSGVDLSLGRGPSRVHILKSIDLTVGRGEAVGLVGPSGSGKSTLLMVMAGLERADAGSIVVAGEDIGSLDEDALARFRGRHVGIVFQSFHLIPTMTALENVAVPPNANSQRSGSPTVRPTIRPSSPAASSNEPHWRVRWRRIPPSWSPTSQPATSTRTPGATSSIYCLRATSNMARRSCS